MPSYNHTTHPPGKSSRVSVYKCGEISGSTICLPDWAVSMALLEEIMEESMNMIENQIRTNEERIQNDEKLFRTIAESMANRNDEQNEKKNHRTMN